MWELKKTTLRLGIRSEAEEVPLCGALDLNLTERDVRVEEKSE
jgi:hypothetical protein